MLPLYGSSTRLPVVLLTVLPSSLTLSTCSSVASAILPSLSTLNRLLLPTCRSMSFEAADDAVFVTFILIDV